MGLLRVLNPLVLNPTAPRHRTARAVEAIARQGAAAQRSVELGERQARRAWNQAKREHNANAQAHAAAPTAATLDACRSSHAALTAARARADAAGVVFS